jgi:hypothetical protein
VALAVSYFTSATNVTTTTATPYTTSSTVYNRDLVMANGGTTPIFVGFGAACTGATSVQSFEIPAGQQIVVMGAVPTSAIIYVATGTGTCSTFSLGWASVVSVI